MEVTSKFKIDSSDEQPYLETGDVGKLTRAHVKQTFRGDIDGHGEVTWLMCYRPDDTADFVGLQHVVGGVGGRSGSMVLETTAFDEVERQEAQPRSVRQIAAWFRSRADLSYGDSAPTGMSRCLRVPLSMQSSGQPRHRARGSPLEANRGGFEHASLTVTRNGHPEMDQQRQEPAGPPGVEKLVAAALDGPPQSRSGRGLQATPPPARPLLNPHHDRRVGVSPRSMRLSGHRQPLPSPNAETRVQGRAGPAPAG
jgi:hypothetical protein